jgi:hypothetical protein
MPEDRNDLRFAAAPRPPGTHAGEGGGRFSRRALKGPRTAEEYLKADQPPAYIRRLRAIELEFQSLLRELERAYEALRAECGHDFDAFYRRWRARAHHRRLEPLNELIRQHNTWYPAEANLPMDPRMRDYVPIGGKSYRRIELTPRWVLEHFPADPRRGDRPRPPTRVPREPARRHGRSGAGSRHAGR